jgi:glycosyltransferase involved in cell wall biosynthesis
VSGPLILTGQVRPPSRTEDGPRVDFVELASVLPAELATPRPATGSLRRLEQRVPSVGYALQALEARRRHAGLLLSLSDKVALAALVLGGPGVAHVAVAHNLTTPRRRALQRRTRWLHRLDAIAVRCRSQARYLCEEAGVPAERVHFVAGKVDHRFFRPQGDPVEGYVLSVGQELRDYHTLVAAVGPLGVPTIIVPSSRWARPEDSGAGRMPPNVTVRTGLTDVELRRLYERCAVVVVPLFPGVDSAAGVTAVLEGMAMQKPVVVSAAPGIVDYVEDRRTGRLVPPSDREALQATVADILSDGAQAQELASSGRRFVEAGCNLDSYVMQLAGIVRGLLVG